ncbi:MAG: acetate/propionate family kinase [Bryobacteraceae bacterium]
MKILVLNSGSNSLKFELIDAEPNTEGADEETRWGSTLVAGGYDNIGKPHSTSSVLAYGKQVHKEETEVRDYGHAAELLFQWIEAGGAAQYKVSSLADVERIGHRVVHGADLFNGPVRIDQQVVEQIEALQELAPLHNQSALSVIRASRKRLGDSVPMIAVFDTVFHRAIPDEAALYPLPLEIAKRHKIRRYGFHGVSHRYMTIRYAQLAHRSLRECKLITLHLEGGSSAAAIRGGTSVDTSMGFTPLEGLMMGTRSGDLDPAIVPYLMRKERLDLDGIETFLNKKCGLLGVSGVSADTRELREQVGEHSVALALAMFSYRVRKYVGAYLAVLGGADAIVAGGGIGENTPSVREQIFKDFDWCGATLDRQRNDELVDREGTITAPSASMPIWVIPTREGLMIAKDVADHRI